MVFFVGAGPGAADLITVRGKSLLEQADVVIYAGSLVNPELLSYTKSGCAIYNSAHMTLQEVTDTLCKAETDGLMSVRLHTGDPSIYGAIREQMDILKARNIPYTCVPGVSSFCGAAAALQAEYTLPGVSQTVILTRMAGRTQVPEKESLARLAAHQATMVLFLSAGQMEAVQAELLAGGYPAETPAAIVYKATWPDQQIIRTTVGCLAAAGAENGIQKTALLLVGNFLGDEYDYSLLYDAGFTHGYRQGKSE
ncbi:MAG TPA: precorrin-4 C(11)-methyltransferase [Firmicutes bacterium]|nr:precorrin-4 C(11)-methyltransferase [Bacillota bacterium]